MALGEPTASIFTGSGGVSSDVTSSDALTSDTLERSYNINSNVDQFQNHINYILRETGTHGDSPNANFNRYLHARQENIVKYAHSKDGYEYIYIRPGDIKLASMDGTFGLTAGSYPMAAIIPPTAYAYAEFTVPRNAYLYTGAKAVEKMNVQVSCSAVHNRFVNYQLWKANQHLQPNQDVLPFPSKGLIQDLKHMKTVGTRIELNKGRYNLDESFEYPAVVGTLGGQDSCYHILTLPPGKPTYQSERIFFGARIPIRMN